MISFSKVQQQATLFATFGILGHVWYLIVSIPDPCCLSYFTQVSVMAYSFMAPSSLLGKQVSTAKTYIFNLNAYGNCSRFLQKWFKTNQTDPFMLLDSQH